MSPRSAAIASALLLAACSSTGEIKPGQGVDVGDASALRKLVPAEDLEKQSSQQYTGLIQQTAAKGALATPADPALARLRKIAARITPHAAKFNPRAPSWTWEVNLIRSPEINAFCMPGGKIAFYTGLLDTIKPSDDEIAIVMGHEIAHALREHGREQMAKGTLTQLGTAAATTVIGEGVGGSIVKTGAGLLTLKFSRDDETDADLVGLEIAARAGYDPRAGVTLWQKMTAASKGAPQEWFSTHPSGETRISEIQRNIPAVLPLYQQAKAAAKTAKKT